MYLYEIIEDYKDGKSPEEKDEIFSSFCSSIWKSSNKRKTYVKAISFNVRKDLLDTALGQIFNTWSDIEYRYCKSMTKEDDWCSLIRQEINNIYTRYFDGEIILGKEYMDLIKTPKKMYYEWISGIDMEPKKVTEIIDDAIAESIKVKEKLKKEKMSLSWNKYKNVITGFLKKCFDNCKLIGEYESKETVPMFDFLTEDHFYVGYICKYLEKEILQYQKRYYEVRPHKKYKRCRVCGALIEKSNNRVLYCNKCKRQKQLEWNRIYMKKIRSGVLEKS